MSRSRLTINWTCSHNQDKLVRFLENHDEPRAAHTFPAPIHKAAAVITYLSPGLRFFHQGQFRGCTKRISPHLVRGPEEVVDQRLKNFYERLRMVLRHPVVRNGDWRLLECAPAWADNSSWDAFIAFAWQNSGGERLLVAVNYAPHQSQCYVRIPFAELGGRQWQLQDLLSDTHYDRDGDGLQSEGLYLDVAPWHYHVFEAKHS